MKSRLFFATVTVAIILAALLSYYLISFNSKSSEESIKSSESYDDIYFKNRNAEESVIIKEILDFMSAELFSKAQWEIYCSVLNDKNTMSKEDYQRKIDKLISISNTLYNDPKLITKPQMPSVASLIEDITTLKIVFENDNKAFVFEKNGEHYDHYNLYEWIKKNDTWCCNDFGKSK